MQTGWLAYAGPYKIEHTPCPDYAGDVIPGVPAKGVLHTTEGGWDGSMAVFKKHYAPHFMVGPGRIAQLLPLGRAAAALEHPAGTPPTNAVCAVQVEIVGYSQRNPWLPDTTTTDALAYLMAELERVADIPLQQATGPWLRTSGWLGHGDVPNQYSGHWDPGALMWDALLARAALKSDNAELKNREGFWAWWAWWLGEGDWKPYGPRDARTRPNVPRTIPSGWWAKAQVIMAGRAKDAA